MDQANQPSSPQNTQRPSIIVLVPAHNEGSGLLPTLDDILAQLNDGDRLLVVADNCNDDTADIARAAGAEVVERNDLTKIGKGYALAYGLRHLRNNVPDIVIVIDADCRLEEGAIHELALTCGSTGRPAQALYVMTAPDGAMLGFRVAEFAWRIKNDLRPRGLAALGLPCQLMGSGMAFPRDVIGAVDLATDDLAEDLALGLQLAFAKHPPLFCPAAVVTSEFPATREAAAAQRQRWEHGHLSIILNESIPNLWTALRRRNWDLFILSLDAAVPPLVLLGLLIVATFVLGVLDVLGGGPVGPLILGSAGADTLWVRHPACLARAGPRLATPDGACFPNPVYWEQIRGLRAGIFFRQEMGQNGSGEARSEKPTFEV